MNDIELQGITSYYGTTRVLCGVDLSIRQGELHTLLGPSGCGKTTLLRLVGGFLTPAEGRILLDGTDITALAPEKRNMGIVFQNYALFPNLTVEENVAYGLKLRRVGAALIRERVAQQLELVGLWEYRSRRIQELSGGQQQRVAVARALAPDPKVLLLDEPMSNLDVSLRLRMREELREIQRKVGVTTLFITHDQQEALAISDTVSVMNAGRIEQTGTPREVYERPQTDFAATFVGRTNRLERPALEAWGLTAEGDHLFVRPERLRLRRSASAETTVAGTVMEVHYQGALSEYTVNTAVGNFAVLELNRGGNPAAPGDRVYLELCR